MGPLCVTDLKYVFYHQVIRSFGQFFVANYHFSIKPKANPLRILSRNLKKFKSHKNSYMRPLCVTDSEYELYDSEICRFPVKPKTNPFGF
jgi:hypothetical protein